MYLREQQAEKKGKDMKKLKKIPHFKSKQKEWQFWQKADSSQYFDFSKAIRGVSFPNLKLTSKPITIRMPLSLIDRLKIKANKMGVPYQALIKQILFHSLAQT